MPKSVLLVDDSRPILMSMSQTLSNAGLNVSTAMSGEEGLSILNSGGKPDLVITDVNMPGMNGLEFLERMRALPGMRFIKVLVMTTESGQDKRDKARSLGATGWLVKPVPTDNLLQVIRQVLPGV